MHKAQFPALPRSLTASTRRLEKNTLLYWQVSRCWHSQPGSGQMTVEKALQSCRGIRLSANPARMVARLSNLLTFEIIHKQADPAPSAAQTQKKLQ